MASAPLLTLPLSLLFFFPFVPPRSVSTHTTRPTHNLSFAPLPNSITFSQTAFSLYSYVSLSLSFLHTQILGAIDGCEPFLSEVDDETDGDCGVPKGHTQTTKWGWLFDKKIARGTRRSKRPRAEEPNPYQPILWGTLRSSAVFLFLRTIHVEKSPGGWKWY